MFDTSATYVDVKVFTVAMKSFSTGCSGGTTRTRISQCSSSSAVRS